LGITLGKHPELQGDQIFNGAVDNASGVAAVHHAGTRIYKIESAPPKRTLLFLATTAEEAGLLGAKYYATHPLYRLEKTLADINIDSMNVWGKARDIEDTSFCMFYSGRCPRPRVAGGQGRIAISQSAARKKAAFIARIILNLRKSGFRRSTNGDKEHLVARAPDAPLRADEFDLHDYHQVSDEVKPDWDLVRRSSGRATLFVVGDEVANGANFPEWKPGNEFKPKRDAMMRKP